MMNGFYNSTNGENLVLNRVNTATGQTFWYEVAKRKYGTEIESMRDIILEGADKWLEALPKFVDDQDNVSFDFTSYNFKTNSVVKNGRWTEPSSGAIAYIFYAAYRITGEQKYLDGMTFTMDAVEDFEKNPYYEVTQDYNPLMASIMNFKYGQSYDIDKMINWIFDADSDMRPGLGVITGEWGGFQADGIVGSTTDGDGFGFLMNTYHLGSVLAPIAKYDARYSEAIANVWDDNSHYNMV